MILENNNLIIDIDKKGAELKSIRSKVDYHEYMWSGDSAYWGKTSPILFPIVGALKNDSYRYQGRNYRLSRHGFARDLDFGEERISDTEVLFTLTDTPKTQESYPFSFILKVNYKLRGRALITTYVVTNPHNRQILLFSLGAHPAFAAGEQEPEVGYDKFYLEFAQDGAFEGYRLEGNLISDETYSIMLEKQQLALSYPLFHRDALVTKSLKSKEITLRNTVNSRGMHFRFEGFPFFGIWAAKDADFVCLEPWCGIADGIMHQQQLEMKEGIQSLPPGMSWQRSWEVVCF